MTMHPRDTHSSPDDEETSTRKRVCKACDRCRLKKSKVSIAQVRAPFPSLPISDSVTARVRAIDANQITPYVCLESARNRTTRSTQKGECFCHPSPDHSCSSFPVSYVEMLEQQQDKLVNALQDLYDRNLNRKAWPGPPLHKTAKGIPLTHDILDRLGLLKLDDHGNYETFEEDTDILRQKMATKEEEPAYPTPTTTQSEFSPVSPNFEPFVSRPFAGEKGLAATRFQPTPPMHSPEEDTAMTFPESTLSLGTSMNLDPSSLQSPSQTWMPTASRYAPGMDYNYDVALSYGGGMGLMPQKANPCLPMSAWNDDDISSLGLGPVIS